MFCGTHKRGPFLNLLPLFWGKKHKTNTWNTASVGVHTFCGPATAIVSKLGTILHYATPGFNFLFCLSYQHSPVVTRLLRSAETLQREKAQWLCTIYIGSFQVLYMMLLLNRWPFECAPFRHFVAILWFLFLQFSSSYRIILYFKCQRLKVRFFGRRKCDKICSEYNGLSWFGKVSVLLLFWRNTAVSFDSLICEHAHLKDRLHAVHCC